MYDVITFGSVTWDIFLELEKYQVVKNRKFTTNRGLCSELGTKTDVGGIRFSSGGGGTNTAVSFSNQGFKTAYCGSVGDDIPGREIIAQLQEGGIDCSLVMKTKFKPTNHSIILNTVGERTVLAYRGASEMMGKKDIPWEKLDVKWFYLAPLSGQLARNTRDIINFAKTKGIKVAFNPGISQLDLDEIEDIIGKVDVLILNQEEASYLTKIPFSKEKEIFAEIDKMCPGIVIMTKGEQGVVVSDGSNLYEAKPSKVKVVDRTGAGDSFGSGFVSGLIKRGSIEYAIQLGMANANGCLQKEGAKNGLLTKSSKFKNVKIKKEKL